MDRIQLTYPTPSIPSPALPTSYATTARPLRLLKQSKQAAMAAAALREQLNALLSSMFSSVSPPSLCVPVLIIDRIGMNDLVNFFCVCVCICRGCRVGSGGRPVPAAADAAGRRGHAGLRRRGRHPLLRRRRQDHLRARRPAVCPSSSLTTTSPVIVVAACGQFLPSALCG